MWYGNVLGLPQNDSAERRLRSLLSTLSSRKFMHLLASKSCPFADCISRRRVRPHDFPHGVLSKLICLRSHTAGAACTQCERCSLWAPPDDAAALTRAAQEGTSLGLAIDRHGVITNLIGPPRSSDSVVAARLTQRPGSSSDRS